MSKNESTSEHPMRQAEDAALNAYREWPVLLVLRQKELQSLLGPTETPSEKPSDSSASLPGDEHKEKGDA